MRNNIKNSKTTSEIRDDQAVPVVTVTYLKKVADVAVCENYGIHGSAPKETSCLMLVLNNDEANRIIIPLSAQTRTKNLEEGEFECGNFVKQSIIKFDKDGNINITSANDINIVAGGGDINVIGDIHVTGDIDATGDIVAGTISLKTHVHSGVSTGSSNTNVPVP